MNSILLDSNQYLLNKYDIYAFDYIEYPHKSFWSEKFGDKDYREGLKSLFLSEKNPPVVLYVHIPFCPQMCWFCVCHFNITHNYDRIKDYLTYLHSEIDMIRTFLNEHDITPNFKECHLGGGSPTYLEEKEFLELKAKLQTICSFDNLDEFTIEIDPRRVDQRRMHFYHEQGIDRISFGVQDFDLEVQKSINRIQPPHLIKNLLTPDIRKHFKSVNFDLLVGLPKQTRESVRRTIDQVIDIGPDRIALSFMHYSPKYAPHQKMMKKNDKLPDFRERKVLHEEAVQALVRSDYVRTGFEHFAKPTDDVAKAVKTKTVQYNSLGATSGRCSYLIGLGESSYGRIGERHYSQHLYEEGAYKERVSKGEFPIYRGHKLTQDDVIRRDVIHTLRSIFTLNCRDIEARYRIVFNDYFKDEEPILDEFLRDGMIEITDGVLIITELGKNFSNLVCRIFDRYCRTDQFPDDFFDAPTVAL
ncbi:MAG: oxygen-independent coproporphyrinogen III oxidase [Candidatus Omnitrophota bacterium]|nr:oxygen-independent coproporphyrinogen III oxidase [Candidatus Omnitrophota bacterium]